MLRILIAIIGLLPSVTIITTYILASDRHELNGQKIPFISFSINYPPESCIGTFGVSISAFTLFCIMFTKYKHIESLIVKKTNTGRESLLRTNLVAMVLGGISAVCMNGVASFQFHNVLYAHLSFAGTFFFLALVHAFMVIYLDFIVSKESKLLLRMRLVVVVLSCCAFVPMVGLNMIHHSLDQNISAASEISCLGFLFIYFITYYVEFKKSRISIDLFHHEEYEEINGNAKVPIESKRFLY
eukprot:TRINITY_DN22374_c0_g1_i1.p1 TRINITY_DN22374_c0_g1~~TRINITY_DN22374_c0_g1_i1.p1  ORF type:complete len:242 (-),score=15.88 TRINITY_DN22374_c0_g1_i1:31-756(-)